MATLLEPELRSGPQTGADRWMLVLFNDDDTPYDVVIAALIVATACDQEEAEMETWEAHHHGSSPVHFEADRDSLNEPARVLTRFGLKNEIRAEFLP